MSHSHLWEPSVGAKQGLAPTNLGICLPPPSGSPLHSLNTACIPKSVSINWVPYDEGGARACVFLAPVSKGANLSPEVLEEPLTQSIVSKVIPELRGGQWLCSHRGSWEEVSTVLVRDESSHGKECGKWRVFPADPSLVT